MLASFQSMRLPFIQIFPVPENAIEGSLQPVGTAASVTESGVRHDVNTHQHVQPPNHLMVTPTAFPDKTDTYRFWREAAFGSASRIVVEVCHLRDC